MLLDRVRLTIHKYRMFRPGNKVVVAVSGGPDSVALLHLLWRLQDELNLTLHVAHMNHRLRGEESQADAAFVRSLAQSLNLPVTVESHDVMAAWVQEGGSLEEVARRIRYEFLEGVAERVGGDKIATGHHADDQAETVLLWLIRGAGPTGLAGIPPVRPLKVVRPLIEVQREEIEVYLKQHGLAFRQDTSNRETIYLRNKVRWQLIPLLKEEFNPNIISVLRRLATILRDEDDYLQGEVSVYFPQVIKKITKSKIILDVSSFLEYHLAIRRRMIRRALLLLRGNLRHIEFDHIESLLQLAAEGPTGKVIHLPDELSTERAGEVLIIKHGSTKTFWREVKVPGQTEIPEIEAELRTEILTRENLPSDLRITPREVAYLDAETLGGPLYVRNRLPGDRFQPLGGPGTKKLKDYFIDQKIPRLERDEIPILTTDEEVVWVGGWRLSEKFKVTDKTKTVLRVNLIQKEHKMLLTPSEVMVDG